MATAEELLDSKNPSRKVPSATGCWGLRYPSRCCYLLTYFQPSCFPIRNDIDLIDSLRVARSRETVGGQEQVQPGDMGSYPLGGSALGSSARRAPGFGYRTRAPHPAQT